MAVGLSTTGLANLWLDTLGGAAATPGTTLYAKLHTGDPGSAGTANASSVTTRVALAWAAAASGSKSINNTPSWATWAGTSPETISHISVWDNLTVGTFRYSFALTTSKTVTTGDTLNLTSHTFALTPLAA